jgi:hypothetical protein
MELFLPSILLMIVSLLFVVYVIPELQTGVLLVGAAVMLTFGLYNHYSTFSGEYRVMDWLNSAQQIAPTILTGLVILLAGGYIAYMYSSGGRAPSLSRPSYNSPPPNTATNPLTEGIGNGLAAAGVTNIARNYSPPLNNSAYRNVIGSAISKGV